MFSLSRNISTHIVMWGLCFFLSPSVFSQNLVLNGGFESYTTCPGSYCRDPREFRIPDWSTAGSGTPDHFHVCSIGEAGVPHKWAGVSHAQEGVAYAGIFAWMNYAIDYREYLQGKLQTPLIQDSTYIVSFYYKLSSYSMYAVDRLGLMMTDTLVKVNHDRVLKQNPTHEFIKPEVLTKETGLWEKASFQYKAKGGEKYVVIGNFTDRDSCRYYQIRFARIQEEMLKFSAYYYIDNVSVESLYGPQAPIDDFSTDIIVVDKPYILKNVHFLFDKYKLQPTSFEELNRLVEYLKKNPHLHIHVGGHTDDVGGEKYNQQLSEQRAKTVKQYLTQQGISEGRIIAKGFGESNPLIPESSEAARSINRRVEILFVQ
jgi:OOP family OmpA-OmpF porin